VFEIQLRYVMWYEVGVSNVATVDVNKRFDYKANSRRQEIC